jgi:hypothetical protein
MSDKIKQQIPINDIPDEDKNIVKRYSLSQDEVNYLKDLNAVKRSFDIYMDQLSAGYMKQVSLRFGYRPEQNLKFEIDLEDPKHEITFTEVFTPKPRD